MYNPFEIELHDGSILDVNIDRCLENMTVVVHAPHNESERLVEFVFEAILRMEFETHLALTGDRGVPLEISGLSRHNDATQQRFLERISDLEEEDEQSASFTDVFHVSMDVEVTHRGFGERKGVNGIHLVCRRVTAQAADKKWYKHISHSTKIPADPLDEISNN